MKKKKKPLKPVKFSRFMNPDGGYMRITSTHKSKKKYSRKNKNLLDDTEQ